MDDTSPAVKEHAGQLLAAWALHQVRMRQRLRELDAAAVFWDWTMAPWVSPGYEA